MLTRHIINKVVEQALAEDAPWGDITTESLLSPHARAKAVLVARTDGVFVGSSLFEATFRAVESWTRVEMLVADGERFSPGQTLAGIEGSAWAVLRAERVALNLVQHLSGVATLTRRFVDAVDGTNARIVDTRKTTPGLRALEKYAVRCGGGHNHRFSLSDAVLVKDNHLAMLAAQDIGITAALQAMKSKLSHTTHIEVEVDRLDQLEPVLAAGVHAVLLDNFSLDDLRAGVALVNKRALVEASGGVRLNTVRAIAETGVDLISVGALTQAAPAIDLGLDITLSGT